MTTSTETAEERRHRLYVRPAARVYALAETWTGDHTPISHDEAARIIHEHLNPFIWTETDQTPPHLTAIPTEPAP